MTRQEQIIALLAERDMDTTAVASALSIGRHIAGVTICHVKNRNAIHICAWSLCAGKWVATYRIGAHPDAPKPVFGGAEASTRKAESARQRAALNAERRAMLRETREVPRHIVERALFGGPASVAVRIPAVPVEAWEAA